MERVLKGRSVYLTYSLPINRLYRISTTVESEGLLFVEMFRVVSAVQHPGVVGGVLSYAHTKGRSFTAMTSDEAPGGTWYIRLKNLSDFPEVVTFDSYAMETEVLDIVPVSSMKDTIVGWDGKKSSDRKVPIVAPIVQRRSMPDLYALMMSKVKK